MFGSKLEKVIDKIYEKYEVDVIIQDDCDKYFTLASEGGKFFRVLKSNYTVEIYNIFDEVWAGI